MVIPRLAVVSLVVALVVPHASAQVTSPPITATVVDFDDMPPGPQNAFEVQAPVTTEYVDRGITFSGFGKSGGGIVSYGNPGMTTPPNWMVFASIASMANGGLLQSPETFTFYPPITYLQFDTSTLSADCENTMVLFTHSFAPGGVPIDSTSTVIPPEAITLTFSFPPPGAERVVLTTSHTCGTGLFAGVEVFSLDTIGFVPVASAASRCAQSALDAAGKKAKAVASCYAKAVQNGVDVDGACLQKASDAFAKAFTKAQSLGDCPTDVDEASIESTVDSFAANAVQTITGGAPGPDICDNKKLVSAGKKAQAVTKCYSTAAKKGVGVDTACGAKAAKSFNSSLKQCGTPGQLGSIEAIVDAFGAAVSRALTVPTTTTTTTTTSTTTTTMAPPLGQHLSFTTTIGTANCGSAKLSTPADAPFSGEIDSDTAGTMPIADLGLGCLYIGGGNGSIPASITPENATTILNSSDGMTLTASFGTGRQDCSRGPEATRHCVNDPLVACTEDTDCGGASGGCAPDANCFFGPPVPVNGFPSSCVVNTFAADASGTIDLATGASSTSITLASRVYLSLGQVTACPTCDGGVCSYGDNQGGACTTTNSALTSLDCPPSSSTFVATLPVDLTPLTTGSTIVSAADGLFCMGQLHAGAFGQPTTQAIQQTGSPAGDLTDGLPHASTLVSNFCIPKTGNIALDNLADLPGPGSLSLPGTAQFVASPSGAFLSE